MSAVALRILSLRTSMVRKRVSYTSDFRCSNRKNLRTWDPVTLVTILLVRCAQSIAWEKLPSTSFAPHQRNGAVLHPAESKTDAVLLVAFHPLTVPKHYPKTGNIIVRSLIFPATLVAEECFHTQCKIRLFVLCSDRRLPHEDCSAPRTRCFIGLRFHLTGNTFYDKQWNIQSDSLWLKPFTKLDLAMCIISM
jgi:hypothetical protein